MKSKSIIFVVIVLILLVWVGVLTKQINDYQTDEVEVENGTELYTVSGFSTDLTQIADEVKGNVVTVKSLDRVSSGFVYRNSSRGFYVITCAHSIDPEEIIVNLDNEQTYVGSLVGIDYYSDVAVIEVEEDIKLSSTKFGDSELINAGEFLLCMGTPSSEEFASSVNFAIVSSKLRTILNSITIDKDTYEYYASLIQLSSPASFGYSGSPCFNMAGEVVGMITMKSSGEIMALPINEIKIVADKFISGREVKKVQLGIKGLYVNELETYERANLGIGLETTEGLYISKIQSPSLGSDIGLMQGDVIVSINGININNNNDYLNVVYYLNGAYDISLYRENELMNITGDLNVKVD